MHKLIEYACEQLEELEKKAGKTDLSAAEVEYATKLAALKKDLLKGEKLYAEMEDDEGYSMAGGKMTRTDGGMSFARGNNRGRGSNAKRDNMGRYSSENNYSMENGGGYSRNSMIVDKLYGIMNDAPDENSRMEIRRLIDKMQNM